MENINHIVHLVLSGRSFDSTLGWLYTPENLEAGQYFRGLAFAGGRRMPDTLEASNTRGFEVWSRENLATTETEGKAVKAQKMTGGDVYWRSPHGCRAPTDASDSNAYHANVPAPDRPLTEAEMEKFRVWPPVPPSDTHESMTRQMFKGPDVDWTKRPSMRSFVTEYGEHLEPGVSRASPTDIMTSVPEQLLPVLTTLAREYAVCDEWFCSVPGQSWANRLFAFCARSNAIIDNGDSDPASSENRELLKFSSKTIMERMDDYSIWKRHSVHLTDGLLDSDLKNELLKMVANRLTMPAVVYASKGGTLNQSGSSHNLSSSAPKLGLSPSSVDLSASSGAKKKKSHGKGASHGTLKLRSKVTRKLTAEPTDVVPASSSAPKDPIAAEQPTKSQSEWSWRVYSHQPLADTMTTLFQPLMTSKQHTSCRVSFSQFKEDAKNGKLAAYNIIEPRYLPDRVDGHSIGANDHSHGSVVWSAEELILDIYDSLFGSPEHNPAAAETLLIITYDSSGGCYDHVTPPSCADPNSHSRSRAETGDASADSTDERARSSTTDGAFHFNRFGPRVPAIFISPKIAPGTILHAPKRAKDDDKSPAQYFDHTSVISSIRERWSMESPQNVESKTEKLASDAKIRPLSERDRVAPTFWNGLFTPQSDPPRKGRTVEDRKSPEILVSELRRKLGALQAWNLKEPTFSSYALGIIEHAAKSKLGWTSLFSSSNNVMSAAKRLMKSVPFSRYAQKLEEKNFVSIEASPSLIGFQQQQVARSDLMNSITQRREHPPLLRARPKFEPITPEHDHPLDPDIESDLPIETTDETDEDRPIRMRPHEKNDVHNGRIVTASGLHELTRVSPLPEKRFPEIDDVVVRPLSPLQLEGRRRKRGKPKPVGSVDVSANTKPSKLRHMSSQSSGMINMPSNFPTTACVCGRRSLKPTIKRALLVGINDYGNGRDLKGATNDVANFAKVLEEYGFLSENVTILTDKSATRNNIISMLRMAAAATMPNDIFVFYYAGHGVEYVEQTDQILGKKPRVVQGLVPVDGFVSDRSASFPGIGSREANPDLVTVLTPGDQSTSVGDVEKAKILTGKVLMEIMRDFLSMNVTLVLDSCHSGNMLNASDGLSNSALSAISTGSSGVTKSTSSLAVAKSERATNAKWTQNHVQNEFVVLSACQDAQRAEETAQKEGILGKFTDALCDVLRNASGRHMNWDNVMASVWHRFQLQNAEQVPQLEGLRYWEVFGTKPNFALNPVSVASISGGVMTLCVGSLHGAAEYSKWRISHKKSGQTWYARLTNFHDEGSQYDGIRSDAWLEDDSFDSSDAPILAEDLDAICVERPAGSAPTIFLGKSEKVNIDLNSIVTTHMTFAEAVTDEAQADISLSFSSMRSDDAMIRIKELGAGAIHFSNVDATSIANELARACRFVLLLKNRLPNNSNRFPIVDLTIYKYTPGLNTPNSTPGNSTASNMVPASGTPRTPRTPETPLFTLDRNLGPTNTWSIVNKSAYRLVITNPAANSPCYVTILCLGSDLGISVLSTQSTRLKDRSEHHIQFRTPETAVRDEYGNARVTLRVVVTYSAPDFNSLLQSSRNPVLAIAPPRDHRSVDSDGSGSGSGFLPVGNGGEGGFSVLDISILVKSKTLREVIKYGLLKSKRWTNDYYGPEFVKLRDELLGDSTTGHAASNEASADPTLSPFLPHLKTPSKSLGPRLHSQKTDPDKRSASGAESRVSVVFFTCDDVMPEDTWRFRDSGSEKLEFRTTSSRVSYLDEIKSHPAVRAISLVHATIQMREQGADSSSKVAKEAWTWNFGATASAPISVDGVELPDLGLPTITSTESEPSYYENLVFIGSGMGGILIKHLIRQFPALIPRIRGVVFMNTIHQFPRRISNAAILHLVPFWRNLTEDNSDSLLDRWTSYLRQLDHTFLKCLQKFYVYQQISIHPSDLFTMPVMQDPTWASVSTIFNNVGYFEMASPPQVQAPQMLSLFAFLEQAGAEQRGKFFTSRLLPNTETSFSTTVGLSTDEEPISTDEESGETGTPRLTESTSTPNETISQQKK
jgi:hypothetical protein